MDRLKPCPFCGGRVRLIYRSRDISFRIVHKDAKEAEACPVSEPFVIKRESFREAKAAWEWRAGNG